eukprot:813920-Rhodomonas_salina.2
MLEDPSSGSKVTTNSPVRCSGGLPRKYSAGRGGSTLRRRSSKFIPNDILRLLRRSETQLAGVDEEVDHRLIAHNIHSLHDFSLDVHFLSRTAHLINPCPAHLITYVRTESSARTIATVLKGKSRNVVLQWCTGHAWYRPVHSSADNLACSLNRAHKTAEISLFLLVVMPG